MGSLPDWYVVIRVARYLGVAPWDLVEQPRAWLEWALDAAAAEADAQKRDVKK